MTCFLFVDDSWLNLTPEQLDKMLEKAAGHSTYKSDSNTNISAAGLSGEDPNVDLDAVTQGIKSFVDKVSSYEGAEFPKGFSDRGGGGGAEAEEEGINFDAGSFEEALENILSKLQLFQVIRLYNLESLFTPCVTCVRTQEVYVQQGFN